MVVDSAAEDVKIGIEASVAIDSVHRKTKPDSISCRPSRSEQENETLSSGALSDSKLYPL